ncbi:hypothetical protein [Synechococcus sp. UW140]|uniref:hypothetical protein n=1 Tax=Synechococcus sp. UW140 TaxID=368503 RepID=UPI0014830ACF|nr:hypothetical protein [Synechococcus sp. UW140]
MLRLLAQLVVRPHSPLASHRRPTNPVANDYPHQRSAERGSGDEAKQAGLWAQHQGMGSRNGANRLQ